MSFANNVPTGGDFLPRVNFNAKDGKMYRMERFCDASGNWSNDPVDITENCAFIADFEGLLVGWAKFTPPVFIFKSYCAIAAGHDTYSPQPDELDAKGNKAYKAALRLTVKLAQNCGGDVREFTAASSAVMNAIGPLVDTYMAAPERQQGLLPVVKLNGTTMTTGVNKNHRPNFEIVQWLPRPDDLPAGGGQGGGAAPAAQAPEQAAPAQAAGGFASAPSDQQPAPQQGTASDDAPVFA